MRLNPNPSAANGGAGADAGDRNRMRKPRMVHRNHSGKAGNDSCSDKRGDAGATPADGCTSFGSDSHALSGSALR